MELEASYGKDIAADLDDLYKDLSSAIEELRQYVGSDTTSSSVVTSSFTIDELQTELLYSATSLPIESVSEQLPPGNPSLPLPSDVNTGNNNENYFKYLPMSDDDHPPVTRVPGKRYVARDDG